MKRLVLSLIAVAGALMAQGQQPKLVITGERVRSDGYIYNLDDILLRSNTSVRLGDQVIEHVTIWAEREGYGLFTVAVNIHTARTNESDVGSYRHAPSTAQFNILKSKIYKITREKQIVFVFDVPRNGDKWYYWNYRYQYVQGDAYANPNENYVYRLPYAAQTSARYGAFTETIQDRPEIKDALWMNFHFEEEATEIFPIRDGLVVRVDVDGQVYVQHEDGTIANYSDIETKVQAGESVTISQPFARTKAKRLIVGLYYYSVNNDRQTNGEESDNWRPFLTNYLNPLFATADGNIKLSNGATVTAIDIE